MPNLLMHVNPGNDWWYKIQEKKPIYMSFYGAHIIIRIYKRDSNNQFDYIEFKDTLKNATKIHDLLLLASPHEEDFLFKIVCSPGYKEAFLMLLSRNFHKPTSHFNMLTFDGISDEN